MSLLKTIIQYCGESDPDRKAKFVIDEPFVVGNHTYATDQRIPARVPGKLVPVKKLESGRKYPPVDQKLICDWEGTFPLKETHAINDRRLAFAMKECDDCAGEGQYGCSCPDCEKMHGCEQCKGLGEVHANERFMVNERSFASEYMAKVIVLPDVNVFAVKDRLFFESGQLQGVLMAMTD